MTCYKDTTFCPYYFRCADGDECKRALTKDVEDAAFKWWGKDGAPIAIFVEKPSCFKSMYGLEWFYKCECGYEINNELYGHLPEGECPECNNPFSSFDLLKKEDVDEENSKD